MKILLIPWVTMFLLLVGAVQVYPAFSTEPEQDYWYAETLEVADVNLPEGINIIPSDPAIDPRGYLTITNTNQPLVFVMSLGYKDVLVMATPDANWTNRVNGAHEAASYLAAPNRPAHLSIESLTSLDQNLEDLNVLSAYPPPQDAPLPSEQSSELLLVYDGQVFEVPFSISYSPNAHFNNSLPTSTATQTSEGANQPVGTARAEATVASDKGASPWLVGFTLGTILILIAWLVGRLLKRR